MPPAKTNALQKVQPTPYTNKPFDEKKVAANSKKPVSMQNASDMGQAKVIIAPKTSR